MTCCGMNIYIKRCKFQASSRKQLLKHLKTTDLHISLKLKKKTNQLKQLLLKSKKNRRRKQFFKREPQTDENQKIFKCNQCKYSHQNFKPLFDHFKSEHADTLNCILCEKSFKNDLQRLAHMKVHGKWYYCSQHYIAFESVLKFKNHVRTKNHNSQCGICLKVFDSKSRRDSHKRSHFKPVTCNKKGEFKCPKCPLVYGYAANLGRHIKTAHENRVFLCEDCGSAFKTNFDLKKHIVFKHKNLTVSPEKKSFQCEFCGKKFWNSGELKIHRASHLGLTDICQYCKESFENVEKLKEHIEIKKHHTFQCSKCSSCFKAKAHLINHLLNHDVVKKVKPSYISKAKKEKKEVKYPRLENGKYPCKLCEKQFGTASNLMRHLDLHSGVRKYKCEKCGKDFKQAMGLKHHLSVHSEDRPYECEICGSRFKDSSTFCKHKKVHSNEANPKRKKSQSKLTEPIPPENRIQIQILEPREIFQVPNSEPLMEVCREMVPIGVADSRDPNSANISNIASIIWIPQRLP